MTYCLAIRVDAGIVFASDTRTNAGVDYLSSHRKLHVFRPADDRIFVLQSAGSLATTQELTDWIRRDLAATDGRESLSTVRYGFEAATYVGRVSQAIQQSHEPVLRQAGFSGEASFILGGETRDDPHRIFLVYPQGNYIEASEDTPYLQIGESKYGKPMLDRLVTANMPVEEAARLALISLDATVRSNLSVGPPFDFAVYERGALALARQVRIHADSPYYLQVRTVWHDGLRATFETLPPFPESTVAPSGPIAAAAPPSPAGLPAEGRRASAQPKGAPPGGGPAAGSA